jgi:O-antigen/teichoic acid export membrane protein
MDIPQRSITSISVPVLSKSWRDKDLVNIKNIYLKSVSNLLTIGFFLFGIIILNVHNIVDFLNWIGKKDGLNYDVLIELVLIFGIARLIDLGTGVNSQVIGTSNYWKFDFFSNLFYIILSLPLNYYLIKYFGLIGLALSNLFALTLYNTYRFIFLYIKFKFQPYNIKHLKFITLNIILILIVYNLPPTQYLFLNIIIKSTSFTIGFLTIFYFIKPSDEISKILNEFSEKLNISFLKRF